MKLSALGPGLIAVALTSPAFCAVIAENGANSSSSSDIPGFDRGHAHAYDGSGLNTATTPASHSNGPDGTMWLSTGTGYGGIDPAPYYQVDLGAVYDITSFHIWNYNEGGGLASRGVNAVDILISNTSSTPSTLQSSITVDEATGSSTYQGEDFTDSFEARYIRFKINSNQGSTEGFYGLSEVQFSGTLVPEPASLGLAAIASLGLLARRRRTQV